MKNSYQSLCDAFEGDRRSTLVSKLVDQYQWQPEKASKAIDEYVMFLYIASLNIGVHLVPTQDIDCVWETDILQSTAQYVQTCQILCGQIIHHIGTAEMQKVHTPAGAEAAFAKTKALFRQYFGQTSLCGELSPAACGLL
ncbi:MAG: hypothetical protein AAGB19_05300 [Cyanobacteria bacterium P01_F01_bin.3]